MCLHKKNVSGQKLCKDQSFESQLKNKISLKLNIVKIVLPDLEDFPEKAEQALESRQN